MAVNTAELVLKFSGDPRQLRQALAQVRTDLADTANAQMKQFSVVVAQWKTQERERVRQQQQSAREIAREEKQLAQTMIRESRAAQNIRKQAEQTLANDIKRFERERLQIATQNEKAIERLAKTEADTRVREGRRAATEIINQLRQQTSAAAAASRRTSSTFLAGAAGGVTALLGVSAVNEIRQAGSAWLDYSSKLENTRIAFTTMLGSAQLAESHLKELQQFALKTPFQFGELIDASQRMQALGFNATQVIPILTDVGNAVAAAGGGSERLDRVTLALSQMQSKGRVATQEMNQLAEAGISGWKILEQQLGKSRAELVKMVEKGQISSKVFLDAFQKFSQQNFGGLMEQQSRTFTGAMSNIKDALLQTSATAFEPLFKKLSEAALRFSQVAISSKDFQEKLKVVGSASVTIFDGIVEAIQLFRDAFRLMVAAISAQINTLIEGFRSLAHATAAAALEAFAVGRALRGDFAGAARAEREAQKELRLAVDSAAKALEAQGTVVRELSNIYRDAAGRARDLADAQAKVGGDVAVGEGILRKKAVTTSDTVPEKTQKGPDPAVAERRVAEIRLAIEIAGLEAEEDAQKRSLARREIDFERYAAEITAIESRRSIAVLGGLIEEGKAAEKLKNANQRRIADAELENKRIVEGIRHKKVLAELDNKRFDINEQITEALQKQNKAVADAKQQASSWQDEVTDLIEKLKKQGFVLTATQEFWLRFNAAIGDSIEKMKRFKEVMRDAVDESVRLKLPQIDPDSLAGAIQDFKERNPLTKAQQDALGPPPARSLQDQIAAAVQARGAFEGLGVAINDALGLGKETAVAFGDTITTVFGEMAQAVGNAVKAFILFGSAQGSFRKFAAEVIASVAQMAVVQAVWELAQGLAMTALAWFTGNPKYAKSASAHYLAAGVYGAIGAVATAAGRLVAGNSFQQNNGGATGGGGAGGTGGGQQTNQQPATVNINRNTAQPLSVNLNINVKRDAGSIVEAVVDDHRNNGRIRQMVLQEVVR